MKSGRESLTRKRLLNDLRKAGAKRPVWKRVREILAGASRREAQVNLYRLNKLSKKDEVVVVPGKLLGVGALDHPLTVAYVEASKTALLGLKQSKATVVPLEAFLKDRANEKNIKIVI